MELSAELQAAIEKTAALLRQVNGKVADLQGSTRAEYRRDVAVNLREFFDAELRHQLSGGDPPAGSFQAAMLADRPKRLTLADRVAAALEMIDDMEREQRSARVRGCVPTEYPRLVPQKQTEQPDPSPLADEPDDLEVDAENLWS